MVLFYPPPLLASCCLPSSSARVVLLSLPPSLVWLPLPSFPWSGCCFHLFFWVVLLFSSSSFGRCCSPLLLSYSGLFCVLPSPSVGGAASSGPTFQSYFGVVLHLFGRCCFIVLFFLWVLLAPPPLLFPSPGAACCLPSWESYPPPTPT